MPGNCNNNPLLAVDKKSAGVVAFDDIRLCINARQLNTLNRTKKHTYMLPRIADILKKAQKVTLMASRSSVQQVENSFIESASSTPTRHGQGFPRINGHIAAQSRSSSLPSGEQGEEICIVHVESVKERATKLLSNEKRAPSDRLCTKEMGTFLGGTKFSVETDHKALSFLHNMKSHMVRDWARYLSTFDFTVSHIPGVDNILPHYLSHLDRLINEHTHNEELREAVIAETAHAERAQTARAHQEEMSNEESKRDAELESDDNPEMYLQGMKREFVELVLEAKWIESREIREKMVTDAHNMLHQGPMGTFWKLLHDSYFWSDMKRDCRRASQKCKQCLCHNVGK